MAWKYNLIKDMEDPSKNIFSDEYIAVIEDAYPKAEKHFLILPQANISNLRHVTKENLPLLEYMEAKGREIAEEYGGGRMFRFGYHADPSMERLHLHVMSDDLNSPSLKHQHHWNNFTTPMFIESSKVIADLEKFGKVMLPSRAEMEGYLQRPLQCHKCTYRPNSFLDLKSHILVHLPKNHRLEQFECNKCSYKANNVSNLKKHIVVHRRRKR